MAGNLTAMIAAAFSGGAAPPVTSDPYYEYTTLLLPGNGTNGAQNNTFLDGSTNNFTITRNPATGPNAPTQGTFSPFSQTGWGNYFNGSTDWLTTGSSVAALGSGNWTVEFWIYPTTSGTDRVISDARTSSSGLQPTFYLNSANNIVFYTNGTNVLSSSSTVSANVWTHIAFVKNSSTTTCYINGTARGTYSDSNTYLGNVTTFGASGLTADSHSAKLTGYISNYRSVVGRAVYTSAFDPPTTPLTRTTGGTNPPQGTETSLLICQSNRFLDSNGPNTPASSPITITPSGSPSVQAFSPFNPSASWSAATYGGSGYFDGSGDWLSAPSNAAFDFGSGDFTIEFWFYATTVSPTFQGLCGRRADAPSYGPFSMGLGGSSIRYSLSTSGSSWALNASGGTVVPNTWNHAAFVRSGTSCVAYLNGVSVITGTVSGSLASSSVAVAIGTFANDGLDAFNGYMSNFRIVKGTAVYSGTSTTTPNFTLPTAPLTATQSANTNGNPSAAITGSATSLLLNYTNGGIYDATSKNDLETVGNAQISTAISAKWGSGSMYFDGTGDYLSMPNNEFVRFGSGDFTIEFWANTTSFGSQTYTPICGVWSGSPASSDSNSSWYVSINAYNNTRKLGFSYRTTGSNVDITFGTATNSTGSWDHYAVVRNGNLLYGFKNGTLLNTGGTSFTATLFSGSGSPFLVSSIVGGEVYNGYIQDLRITKYARYTASFTAPTAAFPTL